MNTTPENPQTDTKTDYKETAKSLASDARDSAAAIARGAKAKAEDRVDAAKADVADEIRDTGTSLRKAAAEMRSGSPQERTVGQLAGMLADASDALRERDMGDIVHEVSAFARRNPVAFIGGAALLGFAATRFAKATEGRPVPSEPITPDYPEFGEVNTPRGV